MSMNLTPYLEDLERRINPQEEDQLLTGWLDFADLKCTRPCFAPSRSKAPAQIEWPTAYINDGLEDNAAMIYHQLKMCSDMLDSGSGEVLCIRSNFGTPIIPTMYGAELFIMPYDHNILPGSRPLADGKDGIKRILANGTIDFTRGYAKRVFEMHELYLELTKAYPKITNYVNYYNPDLQGPLPLCEALWGSDFYMEFYDDPETVEQALDFFTEVYLQFTRKFHKAAPTFDPGHSVEWGCLHRGGTIIRNDAAVSISGDLYEEFVMPRDQRILEEIGGGIHFCGRGDHYVEHLSQIRNLSCINLSQPECNNMETIYRNTVDKDIILFGLRSDEVERALMAHRDLRGRVQCGASMAAWLDKKDF